MFDFTPKHDFLVGIDSDGCAFDTMELKHKECFIPNIINHYDLQGVSKYAREAAEFVNLYSKSRGINRFPALVETLDGCRSGPKSRPAASKIDDAARRWSSGSSAKRSWATRRWKRRSRSDGRSRSEAGAGLVEGGQRSRSRRWSAACRRFPFVRECLEKLQAKADMLVVSATPQRGPEARMGRARSGQVRRGDLRPGNRHEEGIAGRRRRSIRPNHTLMIGDAPGDYKAAAGQQRAVLPDQSRRGRSQLAAVVRRRDRPLSCRHVRRRLSAAACSTSSTRICPSSRRGNEQVD